MKLAYLVLATLLLCSSVAETVAAKGKEIRKSISIVLRNGTKPNIPGPGEVQVNSFTGNLLLQREDLLLPGKGLDLEVLFSYNSGLTRNDWGFGRGWTTNFNMVYERAPGHVIVRREDGQKDTYTGTGPYTPPPGVFDNLTEYAPGKFLLQSKYGIRYFFDDSTHKHLTSIEDPNGNALHLTGFLAWNQPQFITDPSGRTLRLAWTGERLTQIVDSISSPPRTLSYHYDARGNMVRAIDQAGTGTEYAYDARSRLVLITDPRGNTVSVAYNDSGAVSAVTAPGTSDTPPTSISFVYEIPSRKTYVNELVGGAVQAGVYTFDVQNRVVRIQGNCCGYDVQYEYDADNNTTRVTDANGNAALMTYDSRGNLLTETDALAQTASMSYEPAFNRITSLTDRRGSTTTYAYDAHGNLLSVSRPLGVTETFTYDAAGNLLTATDGKGNTTAFTYDAFGNPVSVIRPIGTETFTYDNSGNLTSRTDANGHTTTYSYDLLDRVVSVINPLPATTSFSYDANGNLVSVTDPNGHSTTYAYDARDRVYSVTVPAGQRAMTLDARGNVLQDMDPNGNVFQYSYDAKNRLVGVADPLGHSRSFTYDNNGNVLTETDFNGNLTAYLYDGLNRPVSVTDALGHITTITYDPNNNPLTVTDANSRVTTYAYDALDRRTTVTHPIGSQSFTYDENDNLLTMTDPNGHTTTYAYDALDRLVTVLDPLLHSSTFTYDPAGNPLSATDPNGLTTAYSYDAADRVVSSTNPMLDVTSWSYDAAGNRTSLTLPGGTTVTYTYDASDRVSSIADPLGMVETYSYDANSNILTSGDGNGNTSQYTYDPLDRLTSATAPLGQTTTYAYDNNSNLVATTDGAGNTSTYSYDVLDRQVTEVMPGGATTAAGYDPVGNLVSVVDGRGNVTGLSYDAMDRLASITFPNGSFRQHTYDPGGRRTALQDQNANTITYAYDAVDRLISRNFPDGTSSLYTYDNAGRMLTAINAAAVVTFTYDAAGRVLSEVLNGKTTSHSYNIPGRTVTTTYPGGRAVIAALTLRGQTGSLQSGGVPVGTFTYDPASRLVAQSNGNGTAASFGYNDNSWVTAAAHSRGPVQLAAFNYTFDPRGHRVTVEKLHRPTASEKYTYDATPRLRGYKEGVLVGADIPAPLTQTEFIFDPIGNRTSSFKDGVSTTYVANTINAYTSITGGLTLAPAYDANGNMTSDGTRTFSYDYMDRLTSVVDLATNASYQYDALGRRIQKVVNGTTTKFFYDGADVIEERDGADAVTATFVPGVEAPVSMTRQLAGLLRTFYYHENPLGSVVAVTDDSGRVVERYEYDAFGAVSVYDSAYIPLPASAIGNPYLFAGTELDGETGLYHSGFRHYHPTIGRYMQQDPASLFGDAPDTRNGYSYVANNPTNYLDPEGAAIRLPSRHKGDYLPAHNFRIEIDGLSSRLVPGKGPVKITASQNGQSLRKGWDGTIKGNMFDDGGNAATVRGGRKGWDGTIKGNMFDDGDNAATVRGGRKGWDGTVKGRIDDVDGDALIWSPRSNLSDDGSGGGGGGGAAARGHTKTGHVTLLKRYDDGSAAARGGHTKTGHVTLLKVYDDGNGAGFLSKKGYEYWKVYDDEPDAAARKHTKTGHVSLLKRYDDGSAAARGGHKKTGHVSLLKRNADMASMAVRGKVKVVKDMGGSFTDFMTGMSPSGKKEFKGHVTLLK